MEGTVIKRCSCKDADQDKLYGEGNRLHNVSGLKDRKECFCTVCSPNQRVLRANNGMNNPHSLRKPKGIDSKQTEQKK